MSDYSELKRLADESVGFCDVPIAPDVVLGLIYEVEGLRAQHGRDSAELRSLCQARDDARKERGQLKAKVEALHKDADRFRFIEQDASSGMSKIYGDDWLEVVDQLIGVGDKS